MKFEDLIKDPIFDLPLTQKNEKPFNKFIESLLNTFLDKVNQLDSDFLVFESTVIDPEFIKQTQKIIVTGLVDTIKQYYDGFPSKAYETLNNVLKNEVKDLYEIIKQKDYPSEENFYRIRIKEENQNTAFQPIDLFHIPFSMRGKVSTQRYSIPGFPSLYLSRTLYVCWEELNRPDINKFQAVRFKNNKKITLLDLSPPATSSVTMSHERYRYFMTWPLIACCSVKVRDYSDTFKPEYIIPQLLLQWIRSNDKLDGICYKSNHIEPYLYKLDGELYNIVLPVKESNINGHCVKLKRIFEVTEVVSWQLHEAALGGQLFIGSGKSKQNEKIPELELIKGRRYPYSYSILGKLEAYLDGMNTQSVR